MTVEHSQNGWVASKDKEAINIKHFPVAGTKIRLQCNEICGPVLAAFCCPHIYILYAFYNGFCATP